MKRFDFPLDRVRRWRREQASLEELKLQQFRAELNTVTAAKQQIQSDLARSEQQVLAQPSWAPLELESLESFRLHVRGRVRDFEQRERVGEDKLVEQRQKVLEARRHCELLDRLRHTSHVAWQAEVDKEQEDLAAELFLSRGRRSS
jgi:hypothetical protein